MADNTGTRCYVGAEKILHDYPYPENLLRAVLEDEEDHDYCGVAGDVPRDQLGSVEYVIYSLPPRMAFILHSRYLTKVSYSELSSELKISAERVRQLEAKALSYLRSPRRKRILTIGVAGELSEREAEIGGRARDAGYKAGYTAAVSDIKLAHNHTDRRCAEAEERLKIAALDETEGSAVLNRIISVTSVGLSPRSVNLLKRNGLNTLQDVVRCYDLYSLVGCGTKCVREIITTMERLGFDMSATRQICRMPKEEE